MNSSEKESVIAQALEQRQKEKDEVAVAAAAFGVQSLGLENKETPQDKEEEGDEFHIPQRFTKSGRKRAVPFPVKVRMLRVGAHKKSEAWCTNCILTLDIANFAVDEGIVEQAVRGDHLVDTQW